MKFKQVIDKALDFLGYGSTNNISTPVPQNPVTKDTSKPASRVSYSEYDSENPSLGSLEGFNNPEFDLRIIPKLRYLAATNPDVGAVYNDLIQLTNTGHKINFDQSIPADMQDKMRRHLLNKSAKWGSGVSGINGLVNKWIGQIWISGALSNEWIIAKDFSGVENNVIVNPENIRFKYDSNTTRYNPYQIIKNNLLKFKIIKNSVKLNINTYFYVGILGSTDSPYGIPPFLTAIEALKTQKVMTKNINHILKQLGILGYLEVKLTKPSQLPNESIPAYNARLDKLLIDSKRNVVDGFSDGVVTGFDDDHEFEFHSTTQNLSGVSDIFNSNETQVSNGLKTTPVFIGQKSNGTESNMGIIFTKMLSQLRNVQEILSSNLKMGYLLELQLNGFNITNADMTIEFSPSTITDELKIQQAREIKQRNSKALFIDGIISKDKYAEEMGHSKPFSDKPVIPYAQQIGKAAITEGEKKQRDSDSKTKSERKSREKDKKQPARKDTKNK